MAKRKTRSGGKRSGRRTTRAAPPLAAPSIVRTSFEQPSAGTPDGTRRKLVIVPYAGLEASASPTVAAALAPAVNVSSIAASAIGGFSNLLRRARATSSPMFAEAVLMPVLHSFLGPPGAEPAAPVETVPPAELGVYHVVDVAQARMTDLATELIDRNLVAGAYIKPEVELPIGPLSKRGAAFAARQPKLAAPQAPGAPTPDFSAQQGYLDPSPGGVDARWSWTRPGGRGQGVNIIDIEGGWCLTHEDLRTGVGGLVGGVALPDSLWRDHGTAVLSEMVGDENGFGVTGIAPGARVSTISHNPDGSSQAILQAAGKLAPGDIMLLEMHQPGPRFNFQQRSDQGGYIAVEWWPDDFAAVSYAVRRGIIVVSAAGNGSQNLDDPLYSVRPTQPPYVFPSTWSNPFNRTQTDSGSILVGAGAPSTGSFGPDRSRLDFSNYGALIDAQGWGRDVVACGYGDLQNGREDRFYTQTFAGTSSASPIVVGALAAVQGIRRAMGRPPLTPDQARTLLHNSGAPQQDGAYGPATQRIGNRPDIQAMVAAMP
jgi:hypothetical protein